MIGKLERRLKIKAHIRHKVSGTAEKPRLTVFRSNAQIYAQVIDDVAGKTLASANSLGITEKMTKSEKAAKVGELIAKKAQCDILRKFSSAIGRAENATAASRCAIPIGAGKSPVNGQLVNLAAEFLLIVGIECSVHRFAPHRFLDAV